eukprot:SAG25_NODE_136_length_14215_cov_15.693114_19_plen_64_part_00
MPGQLVNLNAPPNERLPRYGRKLCMQVRICSSVYPHEKLTPTVTDPAATSVRPASCNEVTARM